MAVEAFSWRKRGGPPSRRRESPPDCRQEADECLAFAPAQCTIMTPGRRVERAAVVVATKAGFLPGDSAHPGGMRGWVEDELLRPGVIDAADIVAGCHCMTPAYLRHQLAESLRNLGVDCIDIHYLHNPETQLSEVDRPEFRRRVRDAFATLEAAVAAGEVGVYGVATWDGLRADPSSGGHLSLPAGVVRLATG